MEKYEVKNVKQASDIKQVYEEAVSGNHKYYRAMSGSGRIYGMVNGHHEIASEQNAVVIDGEYWFENNRYVDDTVVQVDYKSMYEEQVKITEAQKQEAEVLKAQFKRVCEEFDKYKAVVEAFKKL